MGKTLIEICLISAHQLLSGAGFGCSLLKHQWYAIAWIDPEFKYYTKTDASRSDLLWGTKFNTSLDYDDDSKIQAALHVEVYRTEPIFSKKKKLHASVTLPLKEILAMDKKQSSSTSVFEKTISCQLRKQNSSTPQGFVKVSFRISAERQDFEDLTGEGMLSTNSGYNSSGKNYMAGSSQHPFATSNQPNSSNSFSVPPPEDNHHFPMPHPLTNNASPQTQHPYYPPPPPMQQPYYPPLPPMEPPYYPPPPMQQPYYPPPPMQQPYYPSAPPLPPPTSNAGYIPSAPPPLPPTSNAGYMLSHIPRSDNAVNIPLSSSSEGYARPGSAGLGAGKIAAGDPAFHGRDVYLT